MMIGATGRNAGKTEFACAVIRRLSREVPVIGVKVTTVAERGGDCPRGGDGCGVCSSFTGDFCITEERGSEPRKDTARMLAAGAKKVFWVQVLRESLGKAVDALKGMLEPGAVMVCESNSLRLAVEPDLFLVAKEKGKDACKPSCREVLALADEVVESDGKQFSLPPENILFSFGHWTYKREAMAIVMAGGGSERMGRDKALLPIEGEPMIQRIVRRLEPSFCSLLISAAREDAFKFLGIEVVPDEAPGAGPLMALASALARSRTEINFVMPCDIPDPPQHLIARLLREARNAEIVVPVTEQGELEPLFAVYRKSVLPSARKALSENQRRVISFFPFHTVKRLALDPETVLWNLNTMQDYQARLKR